MKGAMSGMIIPTGYIENTLLLYYGTTANYPPKNYIILNYIIIHYFILYDIICSDFSKDVRRTTDERETQS